MKIMTCFGVPLIATIFYFLISFLKIVAIDGTPKQVIVTDATGCNPPKLKNLKLDEAYFFQGCDDIVSSGPLQTFQDNVLPSSSGKKGK
jgi:hypothetical protein